MLHIYIQLQSCAVSYSSHSFTSWVSCSTFCTLDIKRAVPAVEGMIHTHTHLFNGSFSGTTRVSWYQKGKTNLDFTEARDSEWQWHQLGHMQVYTSLLTDNHASTPPLSFLQAGCPSRRPTNSVKALKARRYDSPADNCFNLGTDEKDRIYNTGVMTGHLANGERYGVDGVTNWGSQ